jgi:hypothetical protein
MPVDFCGIVTLRLRGQALPMIHRYGGSQRGANHLPAGTRKALNASRQLSPDDFQRLDTALRWVTENGYKPVFYHEGFLGGPV